MRVLGGLKARAHGGAARENATPGAAEGLSNVCRGKQPESVLNPKQNNKDETDRRGLRGQFLKQREGPRAARPVAPGTHVAGAT